MEELLLLTVLLGWELLCRIMIAFFRKAISEPSPLNFSTMGDSASVRCGWLCAEQLQGTALCEAVAGVMMEVRLELKEQMHYFLHVMVDNLYNSVDDSKEVGDSKEVENG